MNFLAEAFAKHILCLFFSTKAFMCYVLNFFEKKVFMCLIGHVLIKNECTCILYFELELAKNIRKRVHKNK